MNHIAGNPPAAAQGCEDQVLLNDWHVVGYSSDIRPGVVTPVTLLERDLVAWRDDNGDVHVWEDLCVHRGARLSRGGIVSNTLVCPYHGWRYDGSGACVLMPAAPNEKPMKKAHAIVHHAVERYGFVWACIGTPAQDIPVFTEWDDVSYKKTHCGPYAFRSGYRALDNFVDPTHFSFVHPGVNGLSDEPDEIPPYEVTEGADGLTSSEVKVTQPYGDPRNIPVISYYSYRIMRPLVAHLSKRLEITDPRHRDKGDPNDRFCTFFTAQQVDPVTSIVRICCGTNFAEQPSDEDFRRRQDIVYAQDSGIVDTQRPERIPVDLRYELHHRSDLIGAKYRRWLKRLGVDYGIHENV